MLIVTDVELTLFLINSIKHLNSLPKPFSIIEQLPPTLNSQQFFCWKSTKLLDSLVTNPDLISSLLSVKPGQLYYSKKWDDIQA
jgi:hypothetical protein